MSKSTFGDFITLSSTAKSCSIPFQNNAIVPRYEDLDQLSNMLPRTVENDAILFNDETASSHHSSVLESRTHSGSSISMNPLLVKINNVDKKVVELKGSLHRSLIVTDRLKLELEKHNLSQCRDLDDHKKEVKGILNKKILNVVKGDDFNKFQKEIRGVLENDIVKRVDQVITDLDDHRLMLREFEQVFTKYQKTGCVSNSVRGFLFMMLPIICFVIGNGFAAYIMKEVQHDRHFLT